MKRCPECRRDYNDDSLSFCLDDGAELLFGPARRSEPGAVATGRPSEPGAVATGFPSEEPPTAILHGTDSPSEAPTRAQIHTTAAEPQSHVGEESEKQSFSANRAAELQRGQAGVSEKQSFSANRAAKPLMIFLGTAILIGAGFFGYRYFNTLPTEQIRSIAVLPFENISGDPDSEYLSDGLAESLIYRLSQLPDLKVSPTSSVFRYKGKEADPQIIAKELGVDSVMTGRITQRGESLTISVNLVDTRNGRSLWGEQYERKLSDLLATQREIVAEITNNLQLELSGESEQKLAKNYTKSNEAYQLYLRGQYQWSKRTTDEIKKAIEAYKQATAIDPNFALAYVGIADAYNSLSKNGDLAAKDCVPLGKEAALHALEIDPTLSGAHAALADAAAIYDWDWALANKEFNRALELDPNVGYVHLSYSHSYLGPMKRLDEMLAEQKRALELEPLSLINNSVTVVGFIYTRQNDKALLQATKSFDLDPQFRIANRWLGIAYIANGKYDEALALGKDALTKWPDHPDILAFIGLAYARSGRRADAEKTIAVMKEVAKTRHVRTYWIAGIYASLGDKDRAFAELEQAFKDRDFFLTRASINPDLDPLRDDPRFRDLLKRMNLPE